MRTKAANILLVTVTQVESKAVLEAFEKHTGTKAVPFEVIAQPTPTYV